MKTEKDEETVIDEKGKENAIKTGMDTGWKSRERREKGERRTRAEWKEDGDKDRGGEKSRKRNGEKTGKFERKTERMRKRTESKVERKR